MGFKETAVTQNTLPGFGAGDDQTLDHLGYLIKKDLFFSAESSTICSFRCLG